MKLLFCALNSKYIHSTLAPWYLSASVERVDGVFSCVFEGIINEKIEDLYEKIKAYEFDMIGFSTYIWNKNDSNDAADGNKLASKINFYGGVYETGVVYEDYQGQNDIYIAPGVIIDAYSSNN